MRTVILESFKDQSTGEIGLGLLAMPRNDETNAAIDGLMIAHDLLEHINGPERIGTIDDELEALGALWYVRGQHGQLRRDGIGGFWTIPESIGHDVVRMYRDHIDGGQYVDYTHPRTRKCAADETFADVLDFAQEQYSGEFSDPESHERAAKQWPAFRAVCLARLRVGYRKAFRKWERKGRFAANSMFWAVVDAVNPYARHVEYIGQIFKLTYGNGTAHCAPDYDLN